MGKIAKELVAPLWFRRWNRKGAAVFHSVHTIVLIGRLRSNVLNSLTRKISQTLPIKRQSLLEQILEAIDKEHLRHVLIQVLPTLGFPYLSLANLSEDNIYIHI